MQKIDVGYRHGPLTLGSHGEFWFYGGTPFGIRHHVNDRLDPFDLDGFRFSVPVSAPVVYVVEEDRARGYHFQDGVWFATDEDSERMIWNSENEPSGISKVTVRPFEPEKKPANLHWNVVPTGVYHSLSQSPLRMDELEVVPGLTLKADGKIRLASHAETDAELPGVETETIELTRRNGVTVELPDSDVQDWLRVLTKSFAGSCLLAYERLKFGSDIDPRWVQVFLEPRKRTT